MIALAYLIVMLLVGDAFARRWSTFTSGPHRLATAFLAGLLLSTWATYLLALAWADTDRPLLPANALFFALGSVVVIDRLLDWRRARPLIWQPRLAARRGWLALRGSRWDWGFMFVVAILLSWMAFTTFSADGEALRVGIHEYGDFGPNTAIAASSPSDTTCRPNTHCSPDSRSSTTFSSIFRPAT